MLHFCMFPIFYAGHNFVKEIRFFYLNMPGIDLLHSFSPRDSLFFFKMYCIWVIILR
jgi:hypothetical protein